MRLKSPPPVRLQVGVFTLIALFGSHLVACREEVDPFHIGMYDDDVAGVQIGTDTSRVNPSFDPFEAFFGERSPEAVRSFIKERVHHVATFHELDEALRTIRPNPLFYQHDKYLDLGLDPDGERELEQGTAAVNLGTGLYVHARINGLEDVTMRLHGRTVTIDSTRVGIIGVPENYLQAGRQREKSSPRVRQIIRQGILVHEARHSDCSGGLLQSTLDAGRRASSAAAFERMTDPSCGHDHALCVGGDLHGLPACDRHAWGSYPAGEVFLTAAMEASDLSDRDRQILRVVVRDLKSRVTLIHRDMMSGRLGPPDLRHSDAVVDDTRGSSRQ